MPLQMGRTPGDMSQRALLYLTMIHKNGELETSPAFQRGSVWTLEQKQEWIKSIMDRLPLPAIFINEHQYGKGAYGDKIVIIDGKQRVEAILGFINNEFPVNGEYYKDQDDLFKRGFQQAGIPIVTCQFETEKECIELYVRLLTTGTQHTTEEIEKARGLLDTGDNDA
jgi:hypothetical protein